MSASSLSAQLTITMTPRLHTVHDYTDTRFFTNIFTKAKKFAKTVLLVQGAQNIFLLNGQKSCDSVPLRRK